MKLRYFFKFDDDGSVDNWQVAETNDGAAKLIAADYTEVTADRYIARLKTPRLLADAGYVALIPTGKDGLTMATTLGTPAERALVSKATNYRSIGRDYEASELESQVRQMVAARGARDYDAGDSGTTGGATAETGSTSTAETGSSNPWSGYWDSDGNWID